MIDARLACLRVDFGLRFERRDGEPEGVSVRKGRQLFAGRRPLDCLAKNVPRAPGLVIDGIAAVGSAFGAGPFRSLDQRFACQPASNATSGEVALVAEISE